MSNIWMLFICDALKKDESEYTQVDLLSSYSYPLQGIFGNVVIMITRTER